MNIGPTEIIIVLAIALLVFGPGKLPQMGKTLGRGIREFKNAAETAKEELGLGEVIDDVNQVKNDITSAAGLDELKQSFSDVTSTIDDVKKTAGVGEIAAGVGTAKAALSFDPRKAAKDLVTGKSKKSSGADAKALEAAESDAGTRMPASPAAGEAGPAEADDIDDVDEELVSVVAPIPVEV
jgi:sec-independent protein translocase protein TatA